MPQDSVIETKPVPNPLDALPRFETDPQNPPQGFCGREIEAYKKANITGTLVEITIPVGDAKKKKRANTVAILSDGKLYVHAQSQYNAARIESYLKQIYGVQPEQLSVFCLENANKKPSSEKELTSEQKQLRTDIIASSKDKVFKYLQRFAIEDKVSFKNSRKTAAGHVLEILCLVESRLVHPETEEQSKIKEVLLYMIQNNGWILGVEGQQKNPDNLVFDNHGSFVITELEEIKTRKDHTSPEQARQSVDTTEKVAELFNAIIRDPDNAHRLLPDTTHQGSEMFTEHRKERFAKLIEKIKAIGITKELSISNGLKYATVLPYSHTDETRTYKGKVIKQKSGQIVEQIRRISIISRTDVHRIIENYLEQ